MDWELWEFRDEGCDLYPSCLSCPLPRCKFDEGVKRTKTKLRAMKVKRMRDEGMSTKEIAKALGVSQRTVQRLLRRIE